MKKSNIIFILSDDQGPWAMGCAGNSEIKTPNLDRLAETGMRFDNFFCTSPVCSPARASLVTGKIPSQHGVHDWLCGGDTIAKYEPSRNGKLIEYLKDHPGYTDYLAESGYLCGISGKWHIGDSHHVQKSFEFWEVHSKGGGAYYNAPMIKNGEVYEEPEYVTDKITDNALKFLETAKDKSNPFYLSVHYTAPHAPWGRKQHPEEIYNDYYNNCEFNSVPSGVALPEWVEHGGIAIRSEEARRATLSGYYAATTAMDQNIGKLIDWLEENNLREDTLIVFTSDNGMSMGHHGIYGKGNGTYPLNMFEEAVKVPFIMSHPGRIKSGVVNTAMLSQYDFLPTILDYTGVEQPDASLNLPGRSFVGIINGEKSELREDVVVFDEYGPVRMVRTRDFKYIHRYGHSVNELYNLRNDPTEQVNLVDNPEYNDMKVQLRKRLDDWFKRYVDPEKDGSLLTTHRGKGQFGLCSEHADGMEIFSPLS